MGVTNDCVSLRFAQMDFWCVQGSASSSSCLVGSCAERAQINSNFRLSIIIIRNLNSHHANTPTSHSTNYRHLIAVQNKSRKHSQPRYLSSTALRVTAPRQLRTYCTAPHQHTTPRAVLKLQSQSHTHYLPDARLESRGDGINGCQRTLQS